MNPPIPPSARHAPLIRQAMAEQGLDGFLIPHEDEHQNEYLPAANDRLAWATGFTGSAGAAVILKDAAALSSTAATPCRSATRWTGTFEISRSRRWRPAGLAPGKGPAWAGSSATTPACTVPTPWPT